MYIYIYNDPTVILVPCVSANGPDRLSGAVSMTGASVSFSFTKRTSDDQFRISFVQLPEAESRGVVSIDAFATFSLSSSFLSSFVFLFSL